MKKNEKRFIFAILILAALLWLMLRLFGAQDFSQISIEKNGEVFGTYSLSEDQTIAIGDTNVCEIKDGQIRMTQATCPDHNCIRQGSIDQRGGMIVCLPNKVVIEGIRDERTDGADEGVDAFS